MRFHEKNPGVFTPGFWTGNKLYEVCFVNGLKEITLLLNS